MYKMYNPKSPDIFSFSKNFTHVMKLEIKIGTYPVDGYVKVDDQIYALQFDGCFWVIINFNKVFKLTKIRA